MEILSTTINRRRRWRPLLEVNQSVALRRSRQNCRTGQTGAMLARIYHMLLFPVNTKTIRFPWQGLLHVASRDYPHAYRHHPALPPPPHSSSPSLRVSLEGITWSPMKMPNQASIKPSASWTKPLCRTRVVVSSHPRLFNNRKSRPRRMRRSEVTPGALRGDTTFTAQQVDGQGRWIVIDGRRWMWKKERGANLGDVGGNGSFWPSFLIKC